MNLTRCHHAPAPCQMFEVEATCFVLQDVAICLQSTSAPRNVIFCTVAITAGFQEKDGGANGVNGTIKLKNVFSFFSMLYSGPSCVI